MATHFKGPVTSEQGFNIASTGLTVGGQLVVSSGGAAITGASSIAGALTVSTGGADVTGAMAAKTSLAIGSGTAITKILKGTVSITPSALAAGAEESIAVALAGATVGDIVLVTPRAAAAETGLSVALAWVSQANEITVRISNLNAAVGLTSAAGTWDYCLIRS